MNRHLLFLGVVAIAPAAFGQTYISTSSYAGNVTKNGGAYAGDGFGYGDSGSLSVSSSDSAGTASSMTFGPSTNNGFDTGRVVGRFQTSGTGNFALPIDNLGNTANVSSSIISTYNPGWFSNSDVFNASVGANGSNDASVNFEFQGAPTPTALRTGGTFTHSMLDNSVYDENPNVGVTVIDKTVNPLLNENFSLPQYTFSRSNITWNSDGSSTASPFIDNVYSGMWMIFDNGMGTFAINGSPGSPTQTFAANEAADSKVVDPFTSNYSVDISTLADGLYTVRYWAIPWDNFGTQTQLGGLSTGSIEEEQLETQVYIVPEPFTMVGIGIAAAGFLRARRRRA